MTREIRNISKTANKPPGSLIYTGKGDKQHQRLVLTTYDQDILDKREIKSSKELLEDDRKAVKWLDIIGLANIETVQQVSNDLCIHPLAQEDILNTSQSPKIEEHENFLFTVTKNIFFDQYGTLDTEQICIALFDDTVVTFQEYDNDSFQYIHQRLEEGKALRKNGPDDLFYALIDSIVDNYFIVLESIGKDIDEVEDQLLEKPEKEILNNIYRLKRELIFFRNILWPTRNLTSELARGEFDKIDEKTIIYFRDVYDHIIQMIDIVETYRDICSGMLDTYLSSIGYKTNEVMKILTIFSTIFIPLTFLAGVYGMNFKYFPELNWRFGYFGFWGVSVLITLFMLRFLRNKGWL
jgi:magnesium transporter